MVHVILCMHTSLLEALCELTEQLLKEPLNVHCLGHHLAEAERDIYQALDEVISTYSEEDAVLILGDLLGSPSATVSMSIPHPSISYLGGVNLPILLELNEAMRWAEGLELSPSEHMAALVERLCRVGRAGVVDSQSYLRPEGEESQIDSSYYEGSVLGLGSLGSNYQESGGS